MSAEYQSFTNLLTASPLRPSSSHIKAPTLRRSGRKISKPASKEYTDITAPTPLKRSASSADEAFSFDQSDKENLHAKRFSPLGGYEGKKPDAKKAKIGEADYDTAEDIPASPLGRITPEPHTPKTQKMYNIAWIRDNYPPTGRRLFTTKRLSDIGSDAREYIRKQGGFLNDIIKHTEDASTNHRFADTKYAHSSFWMTDKFKITLNLSFFKSSKISCIKLLGITTYDEISDKLNVISKKITKKLQKKSLWEESKSEKLIAKNIWEMIKGKEISSKKLFSQKDLKFTSKLAYLMFGIESYRDSGAFIVGAMFLELVEDGILKMSDVKNLPMSKVGAKGASRKFSSLTSEEIIVHKKDPILTGNLMNDFLQKHHDIVVKWVSHKYKVAVDPKYDMKYITNRIYENFNKWFGADFSSDEHLLESSQTSSSAKAAAAMNLAGSPLPSLDGSLLGDSDYSVLMGDTQDTCDTASTCSSFELSGTFLDLSQ